jgi:branched-chain amino acid transport system permease protein
VLISFVLGVLIERVILRPLHNAPVLSVVVVFIGLLAICNSMAARSGAT